jgi:hypothetical protein
MNITKQIFIHTLLLLVVVQGMTHARICLGSALCHTSIEWESNCHPHAKEAHDSEAPSFGHQSCGCIDISITSTADSASSNPNDGQPRIQTPAIIKSAAKDHPFSAFDFSRRNTFLFPDFTDAGSLSIRATILII